MSDFDPKQSMAFRDLGKQVSQYVNAHGDALSPEEEEKTAAILGSIDEEPFHFADEEPLTTGGEKVLTRAFDTRADRYVAIARPRFHATTKEKESFLREARLTSKLQHPNILPVYEMGIDPDGIPFFVMRLLAGEELGVICRKRSEGEQAYTEGYSLDTLLEVFRRVCDAVVYAHARGVLHLDIKPANIVIGRFGQAILFDWGMATVEADAAEDFDPDLLNTIFHSGSMKGTPGYMAPEQVAGKGEESKATDIYALGAVLYHILTGTIPVRGSQASEVLENTRQGDVVSPRIRRPKSKIPVSLEAVAMKALAHKPADRYESVEALREDLSRYLRGFAPLAERASPAKLFQMLMQRHSRVVTAIAMAGIVLTIIAGVFYLRERAQNADLVVARGEALANLESFQREQELSTAMSEDLWFFSTNPAAAMNPQTRIRGYDFLVDELINPASELGEKERLRLLWSKAQIEIVTQRFKAARKSIRDHAWDREGGETGILNWVDKYAKLKPNDSAILTDIQYAEFLREAVNIRYLPELMTAGLDWHIRKQKEHDPHEYLSVIIAYLNLINDTPGWGGDLALEPCEGGFHLDLRGAPYTNFRPLQMTMFFTREYMKPLQLVSLDLSESAIRSSSSMRVFSDVQTLNLCNIHIGRRDWFFQQLRGLAPKRIVLSEGVFSGKQLMRLRSRHEVILADENGEWVDPGPIVLPSDS